MQNKSYMLITTWNAPDEAFNNESQFLFEGGSVDDVFISFHAMQKFVGMNKMPSFSLFDVKKRPDIKQFLSDFGTHLSQNFKELS